MKCARLFLLIPLLAAPLTAPASGKVVTLMADSVICYKRGDWEQMIAAGTDQDAPAMMRLVNSGKCRTIHKATKIGYLDPAGGGEWALIVLESGKTAFTWDSFIQGK
ncbi:hypothetical protein H097_13008 [Pseudomonas sp. FH4]|nr:hypothetical protein H097_13008 [Pseudomonas sp. FH4]